MKDSSDNLSDIDTRLISSDSEKSCFCEQMWCFIARYAWIVFLCIFIFIFKAWYPTHKTKPLKSAKYISPWNRNVDIKYFVHMTDIHVNSFNNKHTPHFEQALKVAEKLKADNLLITGDLVDNWGKVFLKSKFGHQEEADYQLYKKISEPYFAKYQKVIDFPGNHDVFGLYQFESPIHYVLNYSHYLNQTAIDSIEKYWASTIETSDFIYLAINSFRFPSPHAKFDYFARPSEEMAQTIKEELSKANELSLKTNKPVFAACHFPLNFFIPNKGIKRAFKEIPVHQYISGHTHPGSPDYYHHDTVLEIVAPDVKEHKSISVVTYDNGRSGFQSFKLDEVPDVILSHPMPYTQYSEKYCFNEQNTEIRALVFGNNELTIKVSGDLVGQLHKSKEIKPGVSIYSMPMNLSNGFHHLSFSGDFTHEIDFFIGDELPSFKEHIYGRFNEFMTGIFYSIVIPIFILIIIMPCQTKLDLKIEKSENKFLYIFGGFLKVRSWMIYLPKWMRNMFFGLFFCPLIMPICLTNDEGHYGIVTMYGVYLPGIFYYDIWGQFMAMMYEGIMLSTTMFAVGASISKTWNIFNILDLIIAIGAICYGLYFANTAVYEIGGPLWSNLSPLFVLIPIGILIFLIIWRIKNKSTFFLGTSSFKCKIH